jgi:hypothetical protein
LTLLFYLFIKYGAIKGGNAVARRNFSQRSSQVRRLSSGPQIRAQMDAITESHTRRIIESALEKQKSSPPEGPPNQIKTAHRRVQLKNLGLLPGLDQGERYNVLLPGNLEGVAIGVTPHGLVQVEGWTNPFSPKVITPLPKD